jgi:hypothetical protein
MAKNKSATAATKETCSNYQSDQFYLFIFFMTKLLKIKGLCANRVWFFVPILSAHFIALLYCFIASLPKTRHSVRNSNSRKIFSMNQHSVLGRIRAFSTGEDLETGLSPG